MHTSQTVVTPKKKGAEEIFLPYVPHVSIPQTPSVTDVLFLLGFSKEDKYYKLSERHNKPYVEGVRYVAGVTIFEVNALWASDEDAAKKCIATVIISVCVEEARCFFNPTFVEAKIILGEPVPAHNATIDERRRACTCNECTETVRDQSTTD